MNKELKELKEENIIYDFKGELLDLLKTGKDNKEYKIENIQKRKEKELKENYTYKELKEHLKSARFLRLKGYDLNDDKFFLYDIDFLEIEKISTKEKILIINNKAKRSNLEKIENKKYDKIFLYNHVDYDYDMSNSFIHSLYSCCDFKNKHYKKSSIYKEKTKKWFDEYLKAGIFNYDEYFYDLDSLIKYMNPSNIKSLNSIFLINYKTFNKTIFNELSNYKERTIDDMTVNFFINIIVKADLLDRILMQKGEKTDKEFLMELITKDKELVVDPEFLIDIILKNKEDPTFNMFENEEEPIFCYHIIDDYYYIKEFELYNYDYKVYDLHLYNIKKENINKYI